MDTRLDGVRVLVTAGAAGAGRVIAERFADAGATVFVCDVDAVALSALSANRPDIAVVAADVACEEAVDALFAHIERDEPRLDVLVNNAGIAGPTAEAERILLADWERTLAVNLTGHFLCVRRAIPWMKHHRSGVILNISSASAKVGLPMRLPYVVAKGALLSMTWTLARELGPFGIRVNALLPGPIEGDRIRRIIAQKAKALGIPETEYEERLTRHVSMRTLISPCDIAAMTLFLASSSARYITGQSIGVDGNLEYEE